METAWAMMIYDGVGEIRVTADMGGGSDDKKGIIGS